VTGVRTLPLRLAPARGEALDSWVEALARRYRMGTRPMLWTLGLTRPALLVNHLLDGTDRTTWRSVEQAAGLASSRLDAAVWRPTDRLHSGGSRFCPRCLDESGGRWQISWRGNWTVACLRHQVLLADLCPLCQSPQRTRLPGGLEPIGPATCTRTLRRPMRRCGTDLRSAPVTSASENDLAAQRWIDALIADLADPDKATAARAVLADLPTIAAWLLRLEFGDTDLISTRGRHLPRIDAAMTATVLTRAGIVLGSDDQRSVTDLRNIVAALKINRGVPPANMAHQHWNALTGTFPGRYLRVVDPKLTPIQRLRFKTVTAAAGLPADRLEQRRRWLPQQLWPDWTSRLLPVAGMNAEQFRSVMSICLLIPGSPDHDIAALAAAANPRVTRTHISVTLQLFGAMDTGEANTLEQILAICCRLAAFLDAEGAPIDYQRRRERVPDRAISWEQWQALAPSLGAHPGDRPDTGRHLHVQRHLHQLLTGADLADPSHRLTFVDARDRARYVQFLVELTPILRRGLREHAESVLAGLGIDELLAWSPPAACADGLTWPGVDPDSLDMPTIRRLLVEEKRSPGQVADHLGVNIEHVRLAAERLDRPERQWIKNGPLAAQRRQLADQIFTREFFEREYLQAGRTLADIGESTGFSKKTVAERARALGIPVSAAISQTTPIDKRWLKQQYTDNHRSTTDIATEIGTTQMTVIHALERFEIPIRPSGVTSHPHMLQVLDDRLSPDLRAVVEGGLHGWHRLRRFQIAMAFPSLETAAEYLDAHQSALVTQFRRLEADIGAKLFHRSAFGKPHQPTDRGRQLLNDLRQRNVWTLMTEALGENYPPDPHRTVLARAQARNSHRRTASPPKPFDDIGVERIRSSQPLRILLQDAIDQNWADFYGMEITARTGIDGGTLYPLLKRLHAAGWLLSWPEHDQEWLAGAPPGRGPGRRRTYYRFTPDGRRAALHEIERHNARSRGKVSSRPP